MRLEYKKAEFLKKVILEKIKTASVFLFGSRIDHKKKGGDIDILILDKNKKLSFQDKINIKVKFNKKFGEQKLDLVSFLQNERSNFKELILEKALKL